MAASMLSAFTARPIIELRQRDKSRIETILAFGDRVLVGLNTGSLRIYRLNELPSSSQASSQPHPPAADSNGITQDSPGAQPSTKPTDLLREVDKFSTRAIEQLAIIKEANTLVSLSNYHVSLHDLQSYELIDTLSRSKNASCFAVTSNIVKDQDTAIPEIISRLAVAVKRRLLLWTWHESELRDRVLEFSLPEAIRTLTWADANHLVCGMNQGYVMVNVLSSETRDISGHGAAAPGAQGSRFGAASMGYMGLGGYMPKPLATRLSEGQMLLAKDINSLFIDTDGKPLPKPQVPWHAAPESIGYSYPYILALQNPAKGSLEVRNPDTLSLLQCIDLPGAAQLHFPPPTVSLAHAGKGFHISSERAVWKMDATDYDSQVQELVDKGKFDEAISVLCMLEDALLADKTGTLREVKMLKAEVLFKQKKFRESLDLFNEDDVHAPPERVLRLYPRLIAGDLSADDEQEVPTPEEANGDDEDGKPNGDKASIKDGTTTQEAASPAKPTGLARYWIGSQRRAPDSDSASMASSKKDNNTDNEDSASVSGRTKSSGGIGGGGLEGKDLLNALRELNSYLAGTRARLQRLIDPSTGKLKSRKPAPIGDSSQQTSSLTDDSLNGLLADHRQTESDEQLERELRETFTLVDTTLFRSYMFSKPALAGSLFRIPNFCDPDVVNEKLLEHNRYNELVDFFYGKKLHRQALELLRNFGSADTNSGSHSGQYGGGLTASQRGSHDDGEGENPQNGSDSNLDAVDIPEQLRGPRRTVGYLQSLPPDMIDLILEFAEWVLCHDSDLGMEIFIADSENAETLPRERVARYLGSLKSLPAAEGGGNNTAARLETRYLEHIINELGDATPEFHNRLVELLVTDLRQDQTRGQKEGHAATQDTGKEEEEENDAEEGAQDEWSKRMQRLIQFLRDPRSQYSLGKAYSLIPRDDPGFYEALAVVLSNMGNHKQALDIYVFKMRDYAKAEEYCNHVHRESQTDVSPSSPGDAVRRRESMTKSSTDPDDPDATPSIYHTLLSLYLTPSPAASAAAAAITANQDCDKSDLRKEKQLLLDPALSLLSRHGSRLPAASTLSLIPDDLEIGQLEPYFRGRIRAANSAAAEARVSESLRKTRLVDTQAKLLLGDDRDGAKGGGRNRRVVVREDRVCGVCHKRLGNSVIAVIPDNTVVHYGCLGSVGQQGSLRGASQSRAAGSWGRHG